MLPRSTPRLSAPGRMELSPDLISACLALEKYLENPNALTERELVQWGPGPERGGGTLSLPPSPWLLLVHSVSLCFGSWGPQDPSWELVGGSEA